MRDMLPAGKETNLKHLLISEHIFHSVQFLRHNIWYLFVCHQRELSINV